MLIASTIPSTTANQRLPHAEPGRRPLPSRHTGRFYSWEFDGFKKNAALSTKKTTNNHTQKKNNLPLGKSIKERSHKNGQYASPRPQSPKTP